MLELIFYIVFAVTLMKWHSDVEERKISLTMRHYQQCATSITIISILSKL